MRLAVRHPEAEAMGHGKAEELERVGDSAEEQGVGLR